MAQFNFMWVIENLITITEDLFDDIQPLINWRVRTYLEISSVIHRYNRFSCILYDCVTDDYRYMILAIFEYHNIALPDTSAFDELGDWEFHIPSHKPCTTAAVKKLARKVFVRLMIFAFFVSCLERDLIEHNFF